MIGLKYKSPIYCAKLFFLLFAYGLHSLFHFVDLFLDGCHSLIRGVYCSYCQRDAKDHLLFCFLPFTLMFLVLIVGDGWLLSGLGSGCDVVADLVFK